MAHEEELLGKAYDARLMKRLLKYLRPYKWQVAGAIVVTIVISLLGPLRPYLIKHAIDDCIVGSDHEGLWRILILLIGSVLLQAAVQYVQTIITQWIGQKTIYNLRQELFSHLQTLSLRFFDTNPVGRLVTRLTSDVEVLNELFSSGIIMVFADVFVIIWIFVFMFAISWKLTLMVMCVFPFLIVATAIFRKKARESYREIRLLVARMNAFLNERVSGIITVQLFGQEKRTFKEFDKINRDHTVANIKSIFYYAVFYPAVEFLSAVTFGLIVWYGGSLVLGSKPSLGGAAVTIGTLISFIQYTEMFFRPLRDLAEKYNILQSSMASSERLFKLLDDDTIVPAPKEIVPLGAVKGAIEFRNVWFAYNDEDYVLKDVSFTIKPGETVAFVGATGAGKTSITSLVTRFYEFQKGAILIDGIDIRSVDEHELRRNIAI
ncbi:MAG: ABC transporter transmembrane domain-containing protein, partial [Bacteroidota bacterium]|nr:ABC transporter transmembrane domain-containing protein [Bacteroidota bacterium]